MANEALFTQVDSELQQILDELSSREPIFHTKRFGSSFEDFERGTAPDFWEVGASGTVYQRERVWEVLEQRYNDPAYVDEWVTSDFFCRELSADTYLLTYVLHEGDRITRRATVWRREGQIWQVVYHQGTIVHDA